MTSEHHTATRSLRAVSLAITLVSLVAFSSIAYSAYADYNATVGALKPGSQGSAIAVRTVTAGDTVTLYVNVTVPNRGLYTIGVGLSCVPGGALKVACSNAEVSIPPGATQVLQFMAVASNVSSPQQLAPLKGNLSLSLSSFASLSIVVDLGSMVAGGTA